MKERIKESKILIYVWSSLLMIFSVLLIWFSPMQSKTEMSSSMFILSHLGQAISFSTIGSALIFVFYIFIKSIIGLFGKEHRQLK
jgi:hypothetical protein